MASICCGNGVLEKHIGSIYLGHDTAHIDGYDVSSGSIDVARANCKGLHGVEFHVCDVNVAIWSGGYLDAIFANGALHHVTALDHCLGQLAKALKPSGYLYVNDYMGPSRFQFTDVQLRLAREIPAKLPDRFVRTRRIERCDPLALAEDDPSEAVHSDAILPTSKNISRLCNVAATAAPCSDPFSAVAASIRRSSNRVTAWKPSSGCAVRNRT